MTYSECSNCAARCINRSEDRYQRCGTCRKKYQRAVDSGNTHVVKKMRLQSLHNTEQAQYTKLRADTYHSLLNLTASLNATSPEAIERVCISQKLDRYEFADEVRQMLLEFWEQTQQERVVTPLTMLY